MATDPKLVEAISAINRRCDGASSADGQGFNGTDAKFGKALAQTPPEAWSPAVQRQAWELLRKYRKQLTAEGIDYEAIDEPEAVGGPQGLRCIDARNGRIVVFVPYGDSAYPKSALSATWNSTLRCWVVAVAKYSAVLNWAKRNGLLVTDRARAILEEVQPSSGSEYAGTVSLQKGELRLKFDYDPTLVDAIRTVPNRRWDGEAKEWVVAKSSVSLIRKIATEHNLFMTLDVQRLPDVEITTAPMVTVQKRMFSLSFPYDAQLIGQVRQMPGSEWSATARAWLVPIEASDEVLAFVEQTKALLSAEAKNLMREAVEVRSIIESSAAHDAEISIEGFGSDRFQLFPFQRAGVAYAMRAMGYEYADGKFTKAHATTGGVLVGDEMGLGKTSQGLGILKAANAFPAVIVCPASLKLNWKREAEQWIPGVEVKVLSGTQGNLPDADIYVINYDVLTHWVDRFVAINGLVLDESHYVKNGRAQRSKAAIALSDKVNEGGVRVCLSGTPIVNQPLEIMTQLRIINRLDDFGGATTFRNTYGRSTKKSLASLNRKLRSTCYVRRRKADVLTELPPKRWSAVLVEGDEKVMKEYRKAEADIVRYLSELAMKLALESGADTEEARNEAWRKALRARAAEQLVSISTLKQLAAKAKMNAAQEWIGDFLETDKKLVVFGWHRDVVDDIAVRFADGVKIQGGLTPEKRQEAVDLFQNSYKQKVIACNIKAAGVGLTLTAASDVLFLEQGWTPSDMEQGADRCHRIGQQDSVTAWLMLTANTIDEDIAALIDAKRSVVDQAIDGTDADDEEGTSLVGDLLVSLAERGMREAS